MNTTPGIAFYATVIGFMLFACNAPAEKSTSSRTTHSKSTSSSTSNTASKSSEKKTVVTPSRPVVNASGAPGLERDVLNLVNEYRTARKLPPLTNNAHMEFQARRHSMGMATQRIPFGHQGLSFRMKYIQEKVPGVRDVAENVAFGNLSAKAVVDGWLKSPGHKKNIEGNYKYSGVGVARNQNNQIYFTQLFAK
jgi:uncharacterized protein YkwD